MVSTNTKDMKHRSLKSEFQSLLLVVFCALLFRTFVMELYFVPTGSMKATILEGDYIFSTKYSYGFSNYSLPFSSEKFSLFKGRIFSSMPKRGDIIIMYPPHDMKNRYVKRLIALPGEKIELIDNVVYINDQPLSRTEIGEYTDEKGNEYIKFQEVTPEGMKYFTYKVKNNLYQQLAKKYPNKMAIYNREYNNFGPYVIPEGTFFFMGDNRDESADSRAQLGVVPFENLIAKAQFVFFSTSELFWDEQANISQQISRIWQWLKSIRFFRLFTGLYSE
jgi:signal peptidase I